MYCILKRVKRCCTFVLCLCRKKEQMLEEEAIFPCYFLIYYTGRTSPCNSISHELIYFLLYFQQRGEAENLSLITVAKNLKSKASPLPVSSVFQDRQKFKMSQSCPTPPNQRRRFFLNPKVLRSSFAVQKSSRHTASSPEPIINDNPSALSVWTSSMEGKARWPGVVLGKIKSLWSSSQGTANDGLNQLISSTNRIAGRKSF